ncbi:MAG TPA: ATPase, T2SS/T4P/T4SS family, partial [Polyangiaceae bacterium]
MLVQVVIECTGRTERREIDVANGVVTIGRAPSCSLSFESALVSRNHVAIDMSGPRMRVTDSSTNGTLAGSAFVQGTVAEVPFGVPLVVGEYTIWLKIPERAPQPLPHPGHQGHHGPALHPANGAQAHAPPQVRPPEVVLKPTVPPPSVVIDDPDAKKGETDRAAEQAEERARRENVALRREIHKLLLDHLDLATIEPSKLEDPSLRPKVLNALRRIIKSLDDRLPETVNRDMLVGELADEALGLGPLERFLSDPSVNEIMVVDPNTIYIEQKGKLFQSGARFTDDERVRAVIERIVTPLGRRIDESSPLVDARLSDGSRVNAVIRPLALRGSAITIRKFSRSPLDLDKLISFGALTDQMGRFLTRSVIAKRNIVIAGGTGSGKTTLLNVLSGAIPSDERVVTIEDAAELQLRQPHVVSLETRPANMEGKGEYSIRDLVKNALRMRPDRIVVGECRGGEA